MKINLKRFETDIKDKFIDVRKHPELDLWIYNYSNKAMFDNHWTPECRMARGLVVEAEGNIIARPFEKFFNYDQPEALPIPSEPFEVFEKVDGVLGIIFHHNGWKICSRGSFESEFAKEALKIWKERGYDKLNLDTSKTYLAEIIYKGSRIVLDYKGMRDLILITAIDTETGTEMTYSELVSLYPTWTKVKRYDYTDFEEIKKIDRNGEEGFVVRFQSGKRVKMKFSEYKKIHAILSHLNSRTVWEYLRDSRNLNEMLEKIPLTPQVKEL